MQGSQYSVSYVDWMLYCESVVVEVGVGSLVAYRSSERGLLRLNRVLYCGPSEQTERWWLRFARP